MKYIDFSTILPTKFKSDDEKKTRKGKEWNNVVTITNMKENQPQMYKEKKRRKCEPVTRKNEINVIWLKIITKSEKKEI